MLLDEVVKCPYCQAEHDIDLEVKEGYRESTKCEECGNTFVSTVASLKIVIETREAPCLNGEGKHGKMYSRRLLKEAAAIEENVCYDCGTVSQQNVEENENKGLKALEDECKRLNLSCEVEWKEDTKFSIEIKDMNDNLIVYADGCVKIEKVIEIGFEFIKPLQNQPLP